MSLPEFPYLRIVLCFSAGILFYDYLNGSIWASLVPFFVLLSIYLFRDVASQSKLYDQGISGLLFLMLFFFSGGITLYFQNRITQKSYIHTRDKEEVIIKGIVGEQVKSGSKYKFQFTTQLIKYKNGTAFPHKATLIIAFDTSDSKAASYRESDIVLIKSRLRTIEKANNPYVFNYKKFCYRKEILQTGIVKPGHHYLISHSGYNLLYGLGIKARLHAINTIRSSIDDMELKGIAEALLIGQRILMSDEIYQNFSDTGAIHILAVSGLHVAIFISIFVWFFDKIKYTNTIWKIGKICSLITIVWFYVFMTGSSPSVMRAGIMVSLFLIGRNLFKSANNFNILSISGFIMLLYNPYLIFHASFQFSFLSLLSILYFQPKMKLLWVPVSPLLIFLWDLVNVTLSAQILILPLSLYYFHQFPTYFILSSIVAIPLATILIYYGSVIILFDITVPILNSYLLPPFKFLLSLFYKSIVWISELPFGKIENIWLSDKTLLLSGILSIVFICWLEKRNLHLFYSSLIIILLIIAENCIDIIKATNNSKMIIYATYDGTLIDIINGLHLYTYQYGNMSDRTVNYVAKNNRTKHHIKYKTTVANNPGIIQYYNNNVYVYTKINNLQQLRPHIKPDILIVTKAKGNDPYVLLKNIRPKMVILCADVAPWTIKKWEAEAECFHYKIYNMKTNGYFSMSLNDRLN